MIVNWFCFFLLFTCCSRCMRFNRALSIAIKLKKENTSFFRFDSFLFAFRSHVIWFFCKCYSYLHVVPLLTANPSKFNSRLTSTAFSYSDDELCICHLRSFLMFFFLCLSVCECRWSLFIIFTNPFYFLSLSSFWLSLIQSIFFLYFVSVCMRHFKRYRCQLWCVSVYFVFIFKSH